jgi:hypothetical protein
MDLHEAPEASPPDEPDLQEIVSRWAGESRQLLLALPIVLAKLDELKEERDALRSRLMDLEQENLTLRESRENLAESFARLKDLMTEAASDEVKRHPGLELIEGASRAGGIEPSWKVEPASRANVAAPESTAPGPGAPVADVRPEPAPASAPARYVTAPGTTPAREVTPAPTPPNPPVRDVTPMPPSEPPARDAAAISATPARDTPPEPSSPSPEPQQAVAQAAAAPPASAPAPDQANSDLAPPVTEPVAEKEKGAEPSQPNPESKEDKRPLPPRVEPSPVRLAAVFRPPVKKEAPPAGRSSQSPS